MPSRIRRCIPWAALALLIAAVSALPVEQVEPDLTRTVTERTPRPRSRMILRPRTVASPQTHPRWSRTVERVASGCGLALHSACEGSTCVALTTTPDLDDPLGWLEMLWLHPWFVANVAGRDLGLDATPCAQALERFAVDGIRVVERPGEESWCAGRGPDVDTLCDRLAERMGAPTGFSRSTRRLRF